ncbi:MAG: FecR domain-containing protein [Dysgonamonadaceae bacterium]|jgi:hypothetical protein|nr:FecR domain-containing protein [Dysgonamonadaceae bacterium]
MDQDKYIEEDRDEAIPSAREAFDCRRIFNRQFIPTPDVGMEWQRFCDKYRLQTAPKTVSRMNFIWGFVAGIAATIAVFLVMHDNTNNTPLSDEIQVFESIANADEVILSSGDGTMHVITGNVNDSILLLQGINANADSLVYSLSGSPAQPKQMTLVTPRGRDYFVTLSDGTKMWLNAGSRLLFPERFTGDRRIVELQGEAYFVVAKDEKRPFEVRTNFFTTSVLGTEFNLRAYSAADAHLVLVEGKVSLSSEGHADPLTVTPGHKAQWNGEGFTVNHVDTYAYTQWKEGYFYFDNVPLVEIMRELGRWYNVSVVFDNTAFINTRLHFVADRHGDLVLALNNLNILDVVNATLTDEKIVIK